MRWFTSLREISGAESARAVEPDPKSSSRPPVATASDRLPMSAADVQAMQRLVGNQAVLGLLRGGRDSAGGGEPVDAGARDALGARLQRDFSDVRVHTDAKAGSTASALGLQAFTRGRDIYFGGGQYQPRSEAGRRLIGHELAHVAQQESPSGGSAVAERTLEQEADHAAAPGGAVPVSSAGGARVQGKAEPGKEGFWHTVWGGIKWLGTQIWDKVTGAFHRIASWVTRLPTRVGRLMSHLIHGLSTLQPWTLAWWASLTHVSTWGDFLSWLGTGLIDVLEILGIGEVVETVNEFIKFNTRALNGREVALAERVFGKSIDLSIVRVDEGAVLGPSFTKRAFTSFHTINAWGGLEDSVLIHELTHVWQYERAGAIYMAQALHAQIRRGLDAYDYGGPDGLRAARTRGMPLTGFNREEQAQIVQDFFLIKHGQPPWVPGATRADLPLYAHFVKRVSTHSESELLT
jgi:hypothetical protein